MQMQCRKKHVKNFNCTSIEKKNTHITIKNRLPIDQHTAGMTLVTHSTAKRAPYEACMQTQQERLERGSPSPSTPTALTSPGYAGTEHTALSASWIALLLSDANGSVRVPQLFSIFTSMERFGSFKFSAGRYQ